MEYARRLTRRAIGMMLGLAIVACQRTPAASELVGTWANELQTPEVVTLREDGTFEYTLGEVGRQRGTWRLDASAPALRLAFADTPRRSTQKPLEFSVLHGWVIVWGDESFDDTLIRQGR